jgi:hypothetical protein
VIFIGIDDTDIVGTPGTNQLARAILKRLAEAARDSIICRHQLFFDPRVPYTSHNGSASIQLPHGIASDTQRLTQIIRETMRDWFVAGSDPGLCIATSITEEMQSFSLRCKSEVVTQEEAREIAARAGCHLEGLGGTEQGVIGALAAVSLVAGGEDGRVVHLHAWPYPDDTFCGPQEIDVLSERGVAEIRQLDTNEPVTTGPIDIGKHLRPNWRGGRPLLFVDAVDDPAAITPWRAVKVS